MRSKSLTVLDRREAEHVGRQLKSLGLDRDISKMFVLRDWKGGIWVASKGLSTVDFSRLNAVSIGIKVAYTSPDGSIRLVR